MKNRMKISYFSHAFMMLAFMGAVSACVQDDNVVDEVIKTKASNEGLSISPIVSESPIVVASTRAESIEALKEKELNTLDVFIELVGGDGTFVQQYHLTSTQQKPIKYGDLNLLADSWRQALKYQEGNKYNIYIAANNPLTSSDITTVTALKALTFNEVDKEIGLAVLDADGNIGWSGSGNNDTSGNIYKLYAESLPTNGRAYTTEKEFMMDYVIENWEPVSTSQSQVFDAKMNRAAAKIVLNVNFASKFLQELEADELTLTPEGLTATPAWKFNKFAFDAPVFAPVIAEGSRPASADEVHDSGFNIFHNETYAGNDKHFTITTYTYPNAWDEGKNTTDAPSLIVSVRYYDKKDSKKYTTNYYRVPLVKSDITSINRNTIYVINATIATRGSDTHEDVTPIGGLEYQVLPWNNENNSDVIENHVESVPNYYLNVNPKVYTLRGDGEQELIINYTKGSGHKVAWNLFKIDTQTGAKGDAVESTDNSAVWGWFYNSDNKMQTTYRDASTWTHMKVEINQQPETDSNHGTISVKSTALSNRAIKYMLLRVYLNEEATFDDDGNPTYYEDILIRHFPTDNIQNITGSWSSRYGAKKKTPGTGYGTNTQYFANPDNYIRTPEASYWEYRDGPNNWDNYTSEENAYAGPDNYYYWAVYTPSWIGGYYIYYRARYQNATFEPVEWIDYEKRINGNQRSDEHFSAHIYDTGANPPEIKYLDADYTPGRSINPQAYNNHMYVVQISSTSEEYVLGRPLINPATHQSNDDVVSPAFMIASQLGVVSRFGEYEGAIAAEHCATYMEVGDDVDKTRYTGWRLPTAAEIGVIAKYQKNDIDGTSIPEQYRVMATVLGGPSYWALNNTEVETGQSGNDRGFVRCVRDLSADEIEKLNGFEALQKRYQSRQ